MSARLALFPGQGAQSVGMAADFLEAYASVRDRFAEASEALGRDLAALCTEGPEEALHATDVCQPALLTSSLAIFDVMQAELGWELSSWDGMAGLSLGEITALTAAGAFSVGDAARLVAARGRFMQEACDREPSSMTSVIGWNADEAVAVADELRGDGVLVVANRNAPTQMVFSGHPDRLEAVAVRAADDGKRAIPLKVAGAFHSPCMSPADEQLLGVLADMTIQSPRVCVWSNVDAAPHTDAQSIRDRLARQVVSPVLWTDCCARFPSGAAYEIGAGRVLAGLMRKNNPEVAVTSINTIEHLKALSSREASA